MNAKQYKKYHEEHMMHNTGTVKAECLVLLTTVPLCVFISTTVSRYFSQSSKPIIEFFIIILPTILNCTILSDMNHLVLLNIILISVILHLTKADINKVKTLLNFQVPEKKAFITNYRAGTNFFSTLCILAVDFSVFPKRLAKTESFGFGFMDLGVGFFVCSNGLVEKNSFKQDQFIKLVKTVSVLFILGVVRLLSVKSLDYHEHVSEYGVHWNFFFTLAMCRITSHFIMFVTNYSNPLWLFLSLGITHQAILKLGCQEWVLSDTPRTSFFDANREGIVSSLGYVSLYFGATSLGKFISNANTTYKKLFIKLFLVCCLTWVGTFISERTIGVSRKMINLGYIFWVLALSTTELILFAALNLLGTTEEKVSSNLLSVPILLESINANGLFFFLLGNILTGLINNVFQTLLLDQIISMIIIIFYMSVLCTATYYLHTNKIYLKL